MGRRANPQWCRGQDPTVESRIGDWGIPEYCCCCSWEQSVLLEKLLAFGAAAVGKERVEMGIGLLVRR